MFSVLLLSSCGSESAETVQENKYEVLIENSCGFDKDVINKKVYAFASDIDADNALEKIMKLTGLPPNFEIKAANVDNACAVVECDDKGGCKRLIYYNQEFIEKMNDATNTDFTELAILAHEIGHHLSGHTIAEPKNRHEEELEADKFAGFILHQLGASIETTKSVFSYSPEEGSQTHPPKAARIAAITNGWYDSKRKGNSISGSGSVNDKIDFKNLKTYNYDDNEIYVEYNTTSSSIACKDYVSDFSLYDFERSSPIAEAIFNNHTYYDIVSMELLNARVVGYYNNGEKRFNFYVINGKVNGRASWWDYSGNLIYDYSLLNGLLDGLINTKWEDGLGDISQRTDLWDKGHLISSKGFDELYYNSETETYWNIPSKGGSHKTNVLTNNFNYVYEELNGKKFLKKVLEIYYSPSTGLNRTPSKKIEIEINDTNGVQKIFKYDKNGDLTYPTIQINTTLIKRKNYAKIPGEVNGCISEKLWLKISKKFGLGTQTLRIGNTPGNYKDYYILKEVDYFEYGKNGEIVEQLSTRDANI